MLTLDEYRDLGLALREAQKAGHDAEARRIENRLASAPPVIRRIYLGEIPPRRSVDSRPIRPEFLDELLAQAEPKRDPIPRSEAHVAVLEKELSRHRPSAPGVRVGPFRLLRLIGEGGMGKVYLAEHLLLRQPVAIKMLDPSFTPQTVTRFSNEARAAMAIRDPGIVQIFSLDFHVDGAAYIVMEYLEGESLDRRLRRLGRLPLAEAMRITRQVANTIGVAHQRGIVHCDLKPANVFLVPDPEMIGGERAKILDFGIAKLADGWTAKTATAVIMGTPAYMSPEQWLGRGRIDQRSDVYSLGCLLFELISGAPPFDAEGLNEIIFRHLYEPPPSLSRHVHGIPLEVDVLVQRCLAKDPGDRFPSGAELAAAIGRLRGAPPMFLEESAANRVATRSTSGAPAARVSSETTWLTNSTVTSWSRKVARSLMYMIGAAIAAGAIWIAVPRGEHGLTVSPPPTTPEDTPSKVKLAVQKVTAAAAEAQQTTEAARAQVAELSAMIAKRAHDDATLARVAVLQRELEATASKLEVDTTKVEAAALEASSLAGANPSTDVKKLIDDAKVTAQSARSAATSTRGEAVGARVAAAKFINSETNSPTRLMITAEAATEAGDFVEAQRNLDKAARLLRKSGVRDANLDYSYAQLYDRMSSHTSDLAAKRRLLQQAREAYQRFAAAGVGPRVQLALARNQEIAAELEALGP
jgi:serine/threonine protein kinase/ribosomal protein L19E